MKDTIKAVQQVIHDTIANHDTIFIKSIDNLDVIGKIDSMYSNAWNRLIIFWTVLAILIPTTITWFQNRKINIEKKALSKKIDEVNLLTKKMEGNIAHSQAEFSRIVSDNYRQAGIDYIKAAKYFAEAKELANSENSLKAFLYIAKYQPKEQLRLRDDDKKHISAARDIRKDLSTMRRIADLSILKLLDEIDEYLRP